MKHILLLIAIAIAVVSPGFGKPKAMGKIEKVVELMDLTPEMIQELLTGLHPEIAVSCKEGTTLPLQFLSNYRIVSMDFSPNLSVRVETPCYLRFCKKKLYLSFDLVEWKRPVDVFTGELSTQLKLGPSGAVVEATLQD